jgi:CheY-like chemotaxis protein
MSAPTLLTPTSTIAEPVKKKRVLLVDTSRPKRDLRAETMRKLGMDVDCAADVAEARCWWRADLYDLVLFNVQESVGPRDKFCDDMRSATPAQQIMFLVGKPPYLATAPEEAAEPVQVEDEPKLPSQIKMSLAAGAPETAGNWGILEACRRISAARHVSEARASAIRNRPLPPRDSEVSQSGRVRERDLFKSDLFKRDLFKEAIPENLQ